MGRACIGALDLPAQSIQEHLIWDEYALKACESGDLGPTLRFWKTEKPAVVLGYSGKMNFEVNVDACQALGIPIVRRTSGGGTVLLDAGCLNYSLVLPISWHPALSTVRGTNEFIMHRHQAALTTLIGEKVDLEGDTDLAVAGHKFSGNAQRRMKSAVLFHGTFLCEINHDLMVQVLPCPIRQPSYRNGRQHIQFLRNVPIREILVEQAIHDCWQCRRDLPVDFKVNQSLMTEAQKRFAQIEVKK